MAAPDPEGLSLAAKVIMAVAAVGAPIGASFAWLNKRFDKKADKHTVNNQFNELKLEQQTQRNHIGKLFDQIRENEQRAQDRHERLMDKLTERK